MQIAQNQGPADFPYTARAFQIGNTLQGGKILGALFASICHPSIHNSILSYNMRLRWNGVALKSGCSAAKRLDQFLLISELKCIVLSQKYDKMLTYIARVKRIFAMARRVQKIMQT